MGALDIADGGLVGGTWSEARYSLSAGVRWLEVDSPSWAEYNRLLDCWKGSTIRWRTRARFRSRHSYQDND